MRKKLMEEIHQNIRLVLLAVGVNITLLIFLRGP